MVQDSPVASRTALDRVFQPRGTTANSISLNSPRSAEMQPAGFGSSVTKAMVSVWDLARPRANRYSRPASSARCGAGSQRPSMRMFMAILWQVLRERRAEALGQAQRQPLPGLDSQAHLRVRGAQVRKLRAVQQHVLVRQRLGLEPPLSPEVVGAGALAAPSEVEDTEAGLGRMAHELPVHEVVHRVLECLAERAAVIGQDLVLVEEREHAGDHAVVLPDRQQLAVLAELVGDGVKEAAREDRRPQQVHAVGVDAIEAVQMLHAELGAQPELGALARHPPLLAGNGGEVLVLGGGDGAREGHVERLGGEVHSLLGPMAQLNEGGAEPAGKARGRVEKGLARFGGPGADAAVDAV